ncbi:MAG: SpoIVB peptidase [Oscillospiraceae bacterium]
MKKSIRIAAAAAAVAMFGLLGVELSLAVMMPDTYYVAQGEQFGIHSSLGIRVTGLTQQMPLEVYSRAGNRYRMDLELPGGAAIKSVAVQVVERDMVIPGGRPFGIKMFTEGVMVVGMSDLDMNGRSVNPAKEAGIRTGDILLTMNGQKIAYNEDVGKIVSASGGSPIEVTLRRGTAQQTLHLQPVSSPADGSYKAGMWVRDSSAGIGTMTYYNPTTKIFAGLGHAICDVDTGDVMPLASGEAVDVTITGVNRGTSGFPGELKGMFSGSRPIGSLCLNGETGIYGTADRSPIDAQPVELATRGEVQIGEAILYTTVEGKLPQAYSISIERIAAGDANPTKNMVIRVTDPRLLQITGGIVQGMSGSPVLQNGRLVGAVTHVFVNDPTRGYGIFAENMERTMQEATRAGQLAA